MPLDVYPWILRCSTQLLTLWLLQVWKTCCEIHTDTDTGTGTDTQFVKNLRTVRRRARCVAAAAHERTDSSVCAYRGHSFACWTVLLIISSVLTQTHLVCLSVCLCVCKCVCTLTVDRHDDLPGRRQTWISSGPANFVLLFFGPRDGRGCIRYPLLVVLDFRFHRYNPPCVLSACWCCIDLSGMPSLLKSPANRQNRVNPGSKAHRQGIEPGDQVVSINDEAVQDVEQAQQLVRNAGSSLVLQLRRAPRAPSFSRPNRPTFLVDQQQRQQQPSAHAHPPTDSNLDQQENQPPRTPTGDFSSTSSSPPRQELPPAERADDSSIIHHHHQSVVVSSPTTQRNLVPVDLHNKPTTESVAGNSPGNLTDASASPPNMSTGNAAGNDHETRTTSISGAPPSPSFKVTGGKPQIWSPSQSQQAPPIRESYHHPGNHNSAHQDPNHHPPSASSSQNPPPPPTSHSSLSTADDRTGGPYSTHNGVYSPSSSSSGIMSGTNSERTDDLPLGKEYEERSSSIMYRGNQEPHSVMFVDRSGADFSRLPRSQSPTVTLLQKARDGHLHKTPSYAHQTGSDRPEKYESVSSVPSSRGNSEVIHHKFAAPPKYEDIGPTNEKGMPTALRSVVKEDKQHDWYKKMFKAIHRPEDETDFVLVKYQNRSKDRTRYSPTPKNQYLTDAYMSEPELGGRDDNYPHYSTTSDVETSRDYSDYARTHSLPRGKRESTPRRFGDENRHIETVASENPYKDRTTNPSKAQQPLDTQWRTTQSTTTAPPRVEQQPLDTQWRTTQSTTTAPPRVEPKSWTSSSGVQSRYQAQPRPVDNYVPGRSSISMQEALQQMDLYNPPPERPTPQYSATKTSHATTSGGMKPDGSVYRRTASTRALSPEEQREFYKEIQKGGDIPLTGLRMSAPQKQKDADIGPDAIRMELDIDRISAPPSKKPLTDSAGSRNLSVRDYTTPTYYSTPVRSATGSTLERRKSRTTSDYDDIEFDLQKEYKKIDEIYEREREKRQQSQVRDEEKRRHNYVPTLTKSPVPGDRYDSVYDDPFNFRPGRPHSASPGALGFGRRDRARSTSSQGDYGDGELVGPARALYNFTAQNPRELSFRQGDIVQVLRMLDENWIEGQCNNRTGIAPASYLDSLNSDKQRRMERLAKEGQARAKYDFNAQSQVEMSLKKGEIIVLIRRVDRNWYEGKIGARRGILPVAYVEVLKEPGSDGAASPNVQTQPRPRQASPVPTRPGEPVSVNVGSLTHTLVTLGSKDEIIVPYAPLASSKSPAASRKASIVQDGSDREVFGDVVVKEFKTQVSQSPTGAASTLRRNSAKNSISIDELLIPPPPTTTVQEELDLLRQAPEKCRVLYNYRKQHADELELREGEVIEVTERCDDGWFNGKNKRGEQGYFPGNYVQSV